MVDWKNSVPSDIMEYLEKIRAEEKDLIYTDKGLTTNEVGQRILQLNYKKTKYAFDIYKNGLIDRKSLQSLCKENYIDGELIKLWKRDGCANICCALCIPEATKTGRFCVCRVARYFAENPGTEECINCGCKGCLI